MGKLKAYILILCLILFISGCNQSKTNDTSKTVLEDENKVQQSEKPVALYYGISCNTSDQKDNLIKEEDASKKQQMYLKYEREYYLYSNNTFIQKSKGKIDERGLDYYWQVTFPGEVNNKYEVAISKSYNPYPRKSINSDSNFPEKFNSKSEIINEINSKFNVNSEVKELCSIDFDGDGKNEFLILVVDENNNFFAKCLVDSNYRIVSYLTVFKEAYKYFNELVMDCDIFNSGEIIDINNDDIMEIIVQLPSYEGLSFKVFTYKDGNFDGDYINNTTLKP